MYPRLFYMLHTLYLIKRGCFHLWFMDFSRMPGRAATLLWRLGVVGFWHRRVVPRFRREVPREGASEPAQGPALEPASVALPVLPHGACGS